MTLSIATAKDRPSVDFLLDRYGLKDLFPAERVIGSDARTKFTWRDGAPVLVKTLEHPFSDDKEHKPPALHRSIAAFVAP